MVFAIPVLPLVFTSIELEGFNQSRMNEAIEVLKKAETVNPRQTQAVYYLGWAYENQAKDAVWTPGLREIFEYRDLGFKDSTNGDYVAHIVKANGKKQTDEVQHWHIHECDFQCG